MVTGSEVEKKRAASYSVKNGNDEIKKERDSQSWDKVLSLSSEVGVISGECGVGHSFPEHKKDNNKYAQSGRVDGHVPSPSPATILRKHLSWNEL